MPIHTLNPLPISATVNSTPGLTRCALVLLLHGLCRLPATAQAAGVGDLGIGDCGPEEIVRFRGGTARLENDLFAGTDRNYTNGIALTLVSHDIPGKLRNECLPAPVRLHAQLIKFLNPGFWSDVENPAHTQNLVLKSGQSMYTPEDFYRTDLILDDRPYAGLL